MRSLNVAQAKAQLSALLVAEQPAAGFDLEALLAVTSAQPLHKGMDAAALLQELREGARY